MDVWVAGLIFASYLPVMTLTEWIRSQPDPKLTTWALQLGTSPGYLHDLMAGRRKPSRKLQLAIDRLTEGAVPASSWEASPADTPSPAMYEIGTGR